uniref:SH3 domain-containing protein n=1 Tax=Panagrolaimus sp. ES5 TaxID=591445 RepID=A0AC34FNC1_9BILA
MRHQQKNKEIAFEKPPKKEGGNVGGKKNKPEDGIIRMKNGDISCCIPFIKCSRVGHPLPESLADGIKLECTNPDCLYSKHLVHPECFRSLEAGLMKLLTSSGYKYCKKQGILLSKEMLWEPRGVELIQKNLKCECGKGKMRRDDEAWAKRQAMLEVAVKEKEKKKHKHASTLPALQLTVKKGAAPPPNFHKLDTHYLSSHSPPPFEKEEDIYEPVLAPPPAPKAVEPIKPKVLVTSPLSPRNPLPKPSIIKQPPAMKKPIPNLSNRFDSLKKYFSSPTPEDLEPSDDDEEFPSLRKQQQQSNSKATIPTVEPTKQTVKDKVAVASPTVTMPKIKPMSPAFSAVANSNLGSSSKMVLSKEKLQKALVLYSFSAGQSDEMDLIEGSIVTILDKHCAEEGWYLGEYQGKKGIFPSYFVQIIDLTPVTPPIQCVLPVNTNLNKTFSPTDLRTKPAKTSLYSNKLPSNPTNFVVATKTFAPEPLASESSAKLLKAETKPPGFGTSINSLQNNSKNVDDFKMKNFQMELMYLNRTVESKTPSPEPELYPSNTTTTSEMFSNYDLNSNPKKFKNAEIQTDETSFPQNSQHQKMHSPKDCDSEDRRSITPKLSTPLSVSPNEYMNRRKSTLTTSSGFPSVSESELSPFSTTSTMYEYDVEKIAAPVITFSFKSDETFGVEIYQNGRNTVLKNDFGYEWTPLYFSMAADTFVVGERAQSHHLQFPKHVVYDILKIVGKSMNEIKVDPKWKFQVVENEGIKCFEIETQNGPKLFPEDYVVAAFLKAMKIRAVNYLNNEINEIYLSSNFGLTELQKNIFRKAASKIGLYILDFYVNNV